ncbi:hypothetical protein B296_00044639 [Ensete ventricosum]|uniref:Uncharacterized protein n=1 Tax=Ensete ventricosum TaxID=4639 RepID=A0A426YN78_ENSVE|nr:hypothetical protein B296_00044639 [Ensete ventricosum]
MHRLVTSKYWPFPTCSLVGSCTSTISQKNVTVINFVQVAFRSIFRSPSQKFKILAITNVLNHEKSYEHGFEKKYDGHKLCTMARFDQFFMHHFKNSKYWPFITYLRMGSRMSKVSRKNMSHT